VSKGEAILTTGVGQIRCGQRNFINQISAPAPHSAGLGAMGYGYPAALEPRSLSPIARSWILMATLIPHECAGIGHGAHRKNRAKAIILNNQHLGMVMQWEDKFYQGNRGHTYLGDPVTAGKSIRITWPWQKLQRASRARDVQKRFARRHAADA